MRSREKHYSKTARRAPNGTKLLLKKLHYNCDIQTGTHNDKIWTHADFCLIWMYSFWSYNTFSWKFLTTLTLPLALLPTVLLGGPFSQCESMSSALQISCNPHWHTWGGITDSSSRHFWWWFQRSKNSVDGLGVVIICCSWLCFDSRAGCSTALARCVFTTSWC